MWLAVAGGVLGVVSEVLGCTSEHMPSGLVDGVRRILKSECVKGYLKRKLGGPQDLEAPNDTD